MKRWKTTPTTEARRVLELIVSQLEVGEMQEETRTQTQTLKSLMTKRREKMKRMKMKKTATKKKADGMTNATSVLKVAASYAVRHAVMWLIKVA